MHILLIEDDISTAQLLMRLIELWGFSVEHTARGEVALRLLAERRPDVALVDSWLLDMDGAHVIAWMRTQPGLENTPAILMHAGEAKYDDVPADAQLHKPFLLEDLAAALLPYADSDHVAELLVWIEGN